jgi:hypothetical protein
LPTYTGSCTKYPEILDPDITSPYYETSAERETTHYFWDTTTNKYVSNAGTDWKINTHASSISNGVTTDGYSITIDTSKASEGDYKMDIGYNTGWSLYDKFTITVKKC